MAARAAFEKKKRTVEYISVIDDPHALETMLVLSNGRRKIPVIVEGDRVQVGYRGKG